MKEFENSLIKGIHKSRYVASWVKEGGKINYLFRKWLATLRIDGEALTDSEIQEIYYYAGNGKLELESSAMNFLVACTKLV